MAIARGAGTEIIRSASFEHVSNSDATLIIGEQHHIYTVLSVIVNATYLNSTPSTFTMRLDSFDAYSGTAQQGHQLFKQSMVLAETFVWNDKFSFNGYEPDWSGHSGILSTADEQNAIADQAGSNPQLLKGSGGASDQYEIHITYIDQNNA